MKEPLPERLLPPQVESNITVGIVLPEDGIQSLTMTAEGDGFKLAAPDSTPTTIAAGCEVTVTVKGEHLLIRLAESESIETKVASFLPPQTASLVRSHCTTLRPVIAGRAFHWKKEISVTLPGVISLQVLSGSLIVTNTLPFEDYLACVITSEMSPNAPTEFLKAQAIAARSWAYVFLRNKHPDAPFDVCNDDDCQRYQGINNLNPIVLQAFQECRGEYVLTADGHVCPAYYSKCCGGYSEASENVFGFSMPELSAIFDGPSDATRTGADSEEFYQPSALPSCYCSELHVPPSSFSKYLGAVDTLQSYFRWEYTTSASVVCEKLAHAAKRSDISHLIGIEPIQRGASGRIIIMDFHYTVTSGERLTHRATSQYEIRSLLHESFLFSSAFLVHLQMSSKGHAQSLHFRGAGWGHGVGLCQIGAVGMALRGRSSSEILMHYFPGSSLFQARSPSS